MNLIFLNNKNCVAGSDKPKHLHRLRGFTLVELLVVLAIMGILASILLTALSSVSDAGNFGSEVSDFRQLFEDARAYAMANDTYVLMGIEEVDASAAPTAVPQNPGVGRVAVAVVGVTNGTNGLLTSGSAYSIDQANLVAINRLRIYPNLHLQYLTQAVPLSSPLANRYSVTDTGSQDSTLLTTSQMLGYPDTTGASFTWPLSGTSQYTFNRVVEFSPDGSVIFVPSASNSSVSPKWLEIALQQTHGASTPAAPTTATLTNGKAGQQVAAIQIDGLTGTSQLYRQ